MPPPPCPAARPAAVPPGPLSGAPLPPAAAPVQPQPPARSTGRSGEEGRKLCETSVTEVTDLTGVSVLSEHASRAGCYRAVVVQCAPIICDCEPEGLPIICDCESVNGAVIAPACVAYRAATIIERSPMGCQNRRMLPPHGGIDSNHWRRALCMPLPVNPSNTATRWSISQSASARKTTAITSPSLPHSNPKLFVASSGGATPVICTHDEQSNLGAKPCTETQSANQRRVGGWPGSF